MKINHKFLRVLSLLVVAVVLMTSFAYATDLLGLANKGKEYVSQLFSVIALIGVLYAVVVMCVKRNFTTALITGGFGAALVYFIANPDKITSIINSTLGQFM